VGNTRARNYYEACIPDNYMTPREGSSGHSLENWIRAKYEKKQFVPKGAGPPGAANAIRAVERDRGGSRGSPPARLDRGERERERDRERERERAEKKSHSRSRSADKGRNKIEPFSVNSGSTGVNLLQLEAESAKQPKQSEVNLFSDSMKNDNNNLFSEVAFSNNGNVNQPVQPSKDSIMSLYQQPFPVQQQHVPNYNFNLQYGIAQNRMAYPMGLNGIQANQFGYPQMQVYPVGYGGGMQGMNGGGLDMNIYQQQGGRVFM